MIKTFATRLRLNILTDIDLGQTARPQNWGVAVRISHKGPFSYGPPADKNTVRAYTNGEAPDQFAQPRIKSRSSLSVLYLQQDPGQTARMRGSHIFLGPFPQTPAHVP